MPAAVPSSGSDWLSLALTYGPLVNVMVFFLGLVFTWRQLSHARVSRDQQNYSPILARSSDINTRTEGSLYRKLAAEYFMDAHQGASVRPRAAGEEHEAYWGSRLYFLDLIILILQVWLLAERPKQMRGDFAGWEVVAKSVAKEIKGLTYAGKPAWYTKACDDICRYMQDGRVYPPQFVKYMDGLASE